MAFTKYVLPALSVAATAYAASCSNSATATISAPAGVSAIAACQTYTGDVVFQKGAAAANILDLGDLEKLDGGLAYIGDDVVTSITAGSLETITSALNLTSLKSLATLTLTSLRNAGDITMQDIGSLQTFDFGSGLEQAGVITISNTQITSLNGINTAKEISGLVINNNNFLNSVDLNITKVGSIDIGPDAVGQTCNYPNLKSADSLNFRNCSSVDITSLANVTDTLGAIGNTFLNLSAPALSTAGAIVLNDNSELTNVSFPKLATITIGHATFQIANNSKLDAISGFPILSKVNGDVDLSGNFDTVDLPDLSLVQGATNIDTSSDKFDCPGFKSSKGSGLRGAYNCKAKDAHPTSSNGGDGTTDTSGSGSSASSSSVAYPVDIPSFWAGSGVIVGLLGLLL